MPKALVSGGAGFIGSHLVDGLLRNGYTVRVLDNLTGGRKENLEGLEHELLVGDVRDRQAVTKAVQGCELVFHLAALISAPASMDDPVSYYEVNLAGSLALLQAAKEAGTRRVVLASSAAVYGQSEGTVSEQSTLEPVSPYAASKVAMEQAAGLYTRAYALSTVCLRFFNVYGPRQAPDSPYAAAIPIFINTLLRAESPTIHGDGRQTRDFVHVEDVVRGMLLASTQAGVEGSVFNISGGTSISIRELLETLGEILPGSPDPGYGPARPGDVRFSRADLSRARRELGYTPQVSILEGLNRTVAWYRQERHPAR